MLGLMPLTYSKQHLICVHLQKHVWKILGEIPITCCFYCTVSCLLLNGDTCGNGCLKQQLVQIFAALFPTILLVFHLDILEIAFTDFNCAFVHYSVYVLSSLIVLYFSPNRELLSSLFCHVFSFSKLKTQLLQKLLILVSISRTSSVFPWGKLCSKAF